MFSPSAKMISAHLYAMASRVEKRKRDKSCLNNHASISNGLSHARSFRSMHVRDERTSASDSEHFLIDASFTVGDNEANADDAILCG